VFRSHLTRRVKCDKTAKMLTKAHPTDYLSFIGAHSMEGPTRESTSPTLEKWRQTRAAARETKRAANNRPEFAQAQLHQHSADTQTPTKKAGGCSSSIIFYLSRALWPWHQESVTLSLGRRRRRRPGVCDSFAHFFRSVRLT
jgi:hypothetical protein